MVKKRKVKGLDPQLHKEIIHAGFLFAMKQMGLDTAESNLQLAIGYNEIINKKDDLIKKIQRKIKRLEKK